MDNQQGKVTDIDMGWLCGMIDGEGSIFVAVRQPTKKCPGGHPTPFVGLYNTNELALDRSVRILEALEVGHWVSRPRSAQPGNRKILPVIDGRVVTNRKPSWRLYISGLKRVGKILPIILPYLTIKAPQGNATWDYIRHRMSRPWRSQIDEYEARCILRSSVKPSQTTRRMQHLFPRLSAVKV